MTANNSYCETRNKYGFLGNKVWERFCVHPFVFVLYSAEIIEIYVYQMQERLPH